MLKKKKLNPKPWVLECLCLMPPNNRLICYYYSFLQKSEEIGAFYLAHKKHLKFYPVLALLVR